MKLRPTTCLSSLALILALTGLSFRAIAADDKSTTNPTGTWKVTIPGSNTQARPAVPTLKLKLSGGTLTGTMSYRSSSIVNGVSQVSELPITEAKLQGSEISFNFTHPPASGNGPNANYSYQGKISGDSIKGTFTTEWMGQTRKRDWEAERLKQ
ncbi:MAG TPA: hypothetical protein VE263_14785 [Candidatus Angelobacter sp.]|nr:hypothetical protein [Candidatus Angelobacter sp.]